MKKFTSLLILAIMAFSLNGWSQLFLTELADPNNAAGARFVEIHNAGATAVDLSTGYDLQRWTNANTTPQSAVELTGTIPAGGFYVVCANQTTFTATYGFAADQNMGGGGPADGNGDDQLALRDPSDVIIDMFGVPGEDGSGTNHEFEDGRAERKATVTMGNATYTFAEWNIWNDTGGAGTTNLPQNAPDDFDPGAWIGASAAPILTVSPLTLSGLNYVLGSGPSVEQTFTVEGSNLTADIDVTPSTNYEISLDNTTYQLTAITLTQTGGAVATTTIYTRLQAGLAAGDYIEDIVISSTGASDKIVACTGAVEAPAMTTLAYTEPFDLNLGDCYVYSVLGSLSTWEYGNYGGNGYADVNGYGTGEIEEDWLILPGIDFDSYSNERMTFDTWYQYGADDVDNYLKLYWSPDYYGIGDPSSATWTEISFTQPAASNSWETSGTLDLSGITGTNVYLAFKYNYQIGDYRWWQLDNISIYEEAAFVDVTLQVNMEDETVDPVTGVHVAGSFNGWSANTTELLDGDMDDIYEVTVQLIPGLEYQYKFINGDAWGTSGVAQEIVPAECGVDDGSGGYNRSVTPTATTTLDVVCYGSCNDCGYIPPTYDVTFQVDMQNETVGGVVNIAGNFTSWGDTPMTNVGGHIWEYTQTFDEGAFLEYKFKNGGDWEPGANREFWVPSANTVLDLVCYGSVDHCPAVDFVMINEVDSDTPGSDTQEFIELYDGGAGYTPLHGLVVVLYNGSDDASYNPAIDLDGYFTDANGYFVIGSTGMGTPIEISPGGSGWLQNGPDAVALHIGNEADYDNDTPVSDVNLIDALVYDTNDGDDSGLLDVLTPGEPQINEDGRNDKDFQSNQRIPNGSGGLRITSTYDQSPTTMGIENIGIYTDWTGMIDFNWDDLGNWSNGVPTDMLNAAIPDVSGVKAPFPVITGSATCLSLFMAPGSALDIATTGSLTVTGTFTNNGGNLTIKADATGMGSLIESNGVMATMEQHISADAWHMVSSPVAGAQSAVYAGIYLYEWDEPNGDFIEITALNYGLDNKGFYAWSESPIPSPTDVVFTGNLNTGDKNPTLTYNPASYTLPDLPGWNLEGNPYPSGLTWDNTWSQTSLDPTVYIWDAAGTGQWLFHNYNFAPMTNGNNLPGGEIPPTQGFFVKANAASPSMTIPNNKRVHTASNFYKTTLENDDAFEINIISNINEYTDKIFVGLNANATNNFDSEYDAYKLKGIAAAPQLYIIDANENELSVNIIPSAESNLSLPLNLEVGEEATYVLNLAELNGFEGIPIYLEDLLTNTIVNMKSLVNYKFVATQDDDPNRFLLHFGYGETPPFVAGNSSEDIIAYSFENTIVLNTEKPITGEVKVYDILGREIMSEKVTELSYREFQMNELSGYFIVYVISGEDTFAEKVYLK